ncbi:COX15/CtaA family protein [Pedosphaera parvula]|uniref:Cytochrome oxidase assembly n=1 Tax=Pedosphaera parvula (strain Ellin514) TaxID=320771 RepID=B9XST6_PEDPL|nr:COX15/CtaA family protein [Pedosphaera parvula]EEF57103.1 cytochrome oxidase assembly [Pedosphaera parvula Ellin514]
MARSVNNPWLNRFAVFTAFATLVLICIGGLVTSHGAGMAVPDWPTTYGYNMFAFPISKWAGGIFYEHSHRLVASGVGFLTSILTIWLWVKESRRWLRWLGVIAWLAVVLQGVLGGLRVVLYKNEIGIFHAALAQAFFVLVCAIALLTSRWWSTLQDRITAEVDHGGLRRLFLFGTCLIFVQLVIGATMRHQHAGLSIPDFPLAYHKLWPAMDPASVASYNQQREEVNAVNPITAFQIGLQMVHRILALLIFAAVAFSAWSARRQVGSKNPLSKLSLSWIGLICVQIFLGAYTIWSNKAADVATTHVLVGALSLVTGTMLTIVSFRLLIPARAATKTVAEPAGSAFVSSKAASAK